MQGALLEEFDAVCAAIAAEDEPFRRFVEAFEPTGHLPAHYRRLLPYASAISFRVAAQGGWTGTHSQFDVAVGLGLDARIVLILPEHFTSSAAASALAARTGRDNVFHVRRLREVVTLVVDIILPRRTAFMYAFRDRYGFLPDEITLRVSCEDHCAEAGVLTVNRFRGHAAVLFPDPYFVRSQAYERHKLAVMTDKRSWSERSDIVVWRGSTTGTRFTLGSLLGNERIALASLCSRRPDLFDVKITDVVQCKGEETEAIRAALTDLGLLGAPAPFDDFIGHKFALHIDGNSSAWGFLEKLSLSCCVLKVESRFEQWFEARMVPWTHYVPIEHDGSDLVAKTVFLRENPDLAERIARAGFAFAMELGYEAEADRFVRALVDYVAPERYPRVFAAPDGRAERQDGWHDLEQDECETAFRWTERERITWPIDVRGSTYGILQVRLPFRGEIVPGFAERCRVGLGDAWRSLRLESGCLRADLPFTERSSRVLELRTPPLVVPAETTASTDTRRLGLAVRVADGSILPR